jgi:hypothetical protein
MKRPHSDARYYNCSQPDNHGAVTCGGRMVTWGFEPTGNKQAVYECTVCKRKTGEGSLLTEYRRLKIWD